MTENTQKYENWRTITESDYVTMFIKTWFAFVATLREMYPKDNLNEIIGKGDKVFLTPYLDDFRSKYLAYNKIDKIKEDILIVYKLGRKYTLENKRYNRFFSKDFYVINKLYLWKKETDDYECSIKYSSDYIISIHVKYLDDKLYLNNTPLVISEKIDISDLIVSENLTDSQIRRFLDDEASYIDYIAREIARRVSFAFISKIANEDFESKYSSSLYARLKALSLTVNADFESTILMMNDSNIQKENLLFTQSPCANFVYKCDDGMEIPKVDTYKWFLNFVYFMRNALFHEIIDPLDSFWQEIFKHSYFVLKEILDGNISYFLEKEEVKSMISVFAWNEISEKKDIYVPNFNEGYENGEVMVDFIEYFVNDNQICFKANLSLDYWYGAYSQKRMIAVCNAIISRGEMNIVYAKMECTSLTDI